MFKGIGDLIREIDGLEKTLATKTKPLVGEELDWEETKSKIDALPSDYAQMIRDIYINHPERVWRTKTNSGQTIYVRGNGVDGCDVYLIWREKYDDEKKSTVVYHCYNNILHQCYERKLTDWADMVEDEFTKN